MPDERTPEEKMLDEAQAALENGDKGRARDLLTRLIKTNRDNIQYWLLMSASVETNKERIFCLNEALRVDPHNQLARRGLAALGAYPLDETLAVPLAFQKRNWEAALFSPVPQTKRTRRAVIQVGLAMVVLAVIVGAVTLAINFGRDAPAIKLSFGFATPTIGPSVTFEATSSPVVRSVTPTFMGPTPLSMLLAVTYTPTPLYVNTPHNLEDYNRGLKMMKDGNWPLALISFQNAADDLRLAWQTNPNSFPATLGRARASLLTSDLVGANNLLDAATRLVQTDQDKAGVYYYRAQVMEALKNGPTAILAWQALLKLPPKGIPADWLTTANQHLQSLITPTPSPTR
jgi:tetratricopeptide (TPR) repeat protein